MLLAIDYDPTTGNARELSADAPLPAGWTRLLASDYAHMDVTRTLPAEWSEREVPAAYAEDGTIIAPAYTERIQTAPERTELIRAGVCFEYDKRRDEIVAKREKPDPLPMAKECAVAAIASHRYIREVGGFDYMGKRVMSDRESQAKIQGLMVGVQLMGDAFHTSWKCEDGWLDLDKNAAVGLVAAALQHVSGLYVREAAFAGYIVEATTVEAIDNILREF